MGEASGMSRHLMYQALKIAHIPKDVFDAMVEHNDPPTFAELAIHHPDPTMTREKASQAIAQAIGAMYSAYWAACDAQGAAIDPDSLGVPGGLLDEAYEAALLVEKLATKRRRKRGSVGSDAGECRILR